METRPVPNIFGHSVEFTAVSGNVERTVSGHYHLHMDYLVDQLYAIARDPFAKLISLAAPSEFFDELVMEIDKDRFDMIVAIIPQHDSLTAEQN
jgi:hypothetical protein